MYDDSFSEIQTKNWIKVPKSSEEQGYKLSSFHYVANQGYQDVELVTENKNIQLSISTLSLSLSP